jgi:hypothetical protein
VPRRGATRTAAVVAVVVCVLASSAGAAFAERRHPHHHDSDRGRAPYVRPELTVSNVTVVEPAAGSRTTASFTVTLSPSPTRTEWVFVHTHQGTARRWFDYRPMVAWLRFSPGAPLTQTVAVTVYGDNVNEEAETFQLFAWHGRNGGVGTATIVPPGTVTSPPPATTPPTTTPSTTTPPTTTPQTTTPPTTTPPTTTPATTAPPTTTPPTTTPPTTTPPVPTLAMTVTNAAVFEPSTGGLSDGTVTLAPNVAPTRDLVVDYTVVGIDATSGVDFQAQTGTLVFPAGSIVGQEVVVTIIGDELVEPDETVRVNFTVRGGAANLSPSFATVTILDDDSGSGPIIDPL